MALPDIDLHVLDAPAPCRIIQIAATTGGGGYTPIVFALTAEGRVFKLAGRHWDELPPLPAPALPELCGVDGCTRSPLHFGAHGPGATGPHGAPR